jgi:hypothetical protein
MNTTDTTENAKKKTSKNKKPSQKHAFLFLDFVHYTSKNTKNMHFSVLFFSFVILPSGP